MTTGNVSVGFTIPTKTSCSSSDARLMIRSKVWSGGDQTPQSKIYKLLRDPGTGKYYRKRVFVKRRRDPHAYTATFTESVRALHSRTYMEYAKPWCSGRVLKWTQARNCFLAHSSYGVDPFTANDQLKLLGKLHQAVWGSDFDPGVFLAESHQSLSMIASAAVRIGKSFTQARSGNLFGAFSTLGGTVVKPGRKKTLRNGRVLVNPWETPALFDPQGRFIRQVPRSGYVGRMKAANVWAELRWGWLPLINDMESGAQWIAHHLEAPASYRIVKRRNTGRELGEAYPSTPGWKHPGGQYRHDRQLIAYLTEKPNTTLLNSIDPATIAWELMPFSFVVDWFIPIGSYLRARGLPSTLQGTFVTTDLIKKEGIGAKLKLGADACPKDKDTTSDLLVDKTLTFTMTRAVSTTLAIPRPQFKGFGQVASWKHAVDSLALLQQRLRS